MSVCLSGFSNADAAAVEVRSGWARCAAPSRRRILRLEDRGWRPGGRLRDRCSPRHGDRPRRVPGGIDHAATIFDIPPSVGPPGTIFSVGLAGFAQNQSVQVDVYRYARRDPGGGAVYEFYSSLSAVRTNSRGDAIVRISTQPGDPDSDYCLLT